MTSEAGPISAQQALDIILASLRPAGTVTVSLGSALRHALAEDIVAAEDVPSFVNSAMDGYALRSEDCRNAPVTLPVAGEAAAGSPFPRALAPGEAAAVSTGSVVPKGADAVVQIEWTGKADAGSVRVLRAVAPGHNIRPAGGDVKRGTKVLEAGTALRPQELGLLASLGIDFVSVHRIPSVAILTTGDEIARPGRPLREGTIRNSNAVVLAGLVAELGSRPVDLGVAKDDAAALRERLGQAAGADMLVTSGGVSVGRHDLIRRTLLDLGAEIRFWKINIKPGMPMLFAMLGGKPVFGLPGNPVSTAVTFQRFVRPAILRMAGHSNPGSGLVLRARLLHEVTKSDGKRHFVRGILEFAGGKPVVRSTGQQTSNVLTSLVRANCLIIVPEEIERLSEGDEADVEMLL